jgi:hypothetical protein
MNISSASEQAAVVELTRAEVVALRNLLEYAPHVPLEARGPLAIYELLLTEFQPLAAGMGPE